MNTKFSNYTLAKKEAKKAMSKASFNAYESSYKKLDTKEGEKNIYKLARTREKKNRDLGNVRCNK